MNQTTTSQTDSYHQPVMVKEVTSLFAETTGLLVDATFGGGGHSRALLESNPRLRILGIDRDPDAMSLARAGIDDPRVHLVAANFGDLGKILAQEVPDGDLSGALFDLGVSSHQLDTADRGFSYHSSGPLDMRMGPDATHSAADVVNRWTADEIARILREYGEERFAWRIANAIVSARPVVDTVQLASVVADAVPAAARRRKHPARRTFQAIRIAVNGELAALAAGLDAALDAVRPGGRVVVISYHSLEDRIVKRRFVAGATDCTCPPDLPVCVCDTAAELRIMTRKATRPGAVEIENNPRARSALLRAVEKVAS
jgi:16S rRNA (cytosine1402-N4)-methyltransferase